MSDSGTRQLGLRLAFGLVLLWTAGNTYAQKPASGGSTVPDAMKNIHWLSHAFGVGTIMELSKKQTRTDDTTFRFGIECSKPGFVGTSSKLGLLNSLTDATYSSIKENAGNQKALNPDLLEQISYKYFVHDTIISIVITHSRNYYRSEGTMFFTVLHFDHKNQQLLSNDKIFEVFALNKSAVLNAFAEQCIWPDESQQPLFEHLWFENLCRSDLNLLKMYLDDRHHVHIIYPLAENGIEDEIVLK
ncbi:MAG: hypothetical protein IPM52_07160 [Bacteroidetes bacterium]|nr:hypothetical protein [Bacteroidota bacterium]